MHSTTLHCTASSPGKQRTEDSSNNTISSSTEKGEGQLGLGNLHMLEQIFGASRNIRCLSNVHRTSIAENACVYRFLLAAFKVLAAKTLL